MNRDNYFSRLLRAVLARRDSDGGDLPANATAQELRARIASVQLELKSREEQIERMRREYASVEVARDRAASAGGQEQVERLLRKLCGPLSNLAVLAAAARAGKDVAAKDMASLVADVEKQLAAAGLLIIGASGEATVFDVALHQRMSGGAVHSGTPVVVRVPGYKLGEKVLQKALVTARAEP